LSGRFSAQSEIEIVFWTTDQVGRPANRGPSSTRRKTEKNRRRKDFRQPPSNNNPNPYRKPDQTPLLKCEFLLRFQEKEYHPNAATKDFTEEDQRRRTSNMLNVRFTGHTAVRLQQRDNRFRFGRTKTLSKKALCFDGSSGSAGWKSIEASDMKSLILDTGTA